MAVHIALELSLVSKRLKRNLLPFLERCELEIVAFLNVAALARYLEISGESGKGTNFSRIVQGVRFL